MEHRLSKRIFGKLGLLVYKRGLPVATGQIRDASKRGLFIATDYTDLQLNQTVELEFRFPDEPVLSWADLGHEPRRGLPFAIAP